MKKTYLLIIIMISMVYNLKANDTMGVSFGINSHSFEQEPVNIGDTRDKQRNININISPFLLIDFNDKNGFLGGFYLSGSLSKNEKNVNNYDDYLDYAPQSAGILCRYQFEKPFGIESKFGYSNAQVGTRTARGYQYGIASYYNLTKHYKIGVKGDYYDYSYKKRGTKIKTPLTSIGIYLSYDLY